MTTDRLTTSRPRKAPRPVPIADACVRHDVLAVDAKGAATRLHSGIRWREEALHLFDKAAREAGQFPAGSAPTVVLERVTVESVAIREPDGFLSMAGPHYPPASEEPAPVRSTFRECIDRIAEAFARGLKGVADELEAQNKARAMGMVATGLEGETPVAVLFDIAASHQGGNSRNGALIARALGIPFPITMPDLGHRALEVGLKPRQIWPWWAQAPATMDEARRLIARANAPESALCEGGCGRLRVEPCACPTTEPTD